MKKKTNIGENVKKLIYFNTIDRRETAMDWSLPKPK